MISRFLNFIVLAVLGLSSSICYANRLINIPTSSMLAPRESEFNFAMLGSDPSKYYAWFNYGLTEQIEVSTTRASSVEQGEYTTMNAEWHVFPLVPGLLPGVSVGVEDILGQSSFGAGVYVVITHNIMLEGGPDGRDFVLHLGIGSQGIKGVFVGFEMPVTEKLTFIAEHDSRDVNLALQWQLSPDVNIRGYLLHERQYLGASFRFRL
ncbi:MAG: hypothetical protein WCO51_02235 [bacterium]